MDCQLLTLYNQLVAEDHNVFSHSAVLMFLLQLKATLLPHTQWDMFHTLRLVHWSYTETHARARTHTHTCTHTHILSLTTNLCFLSLILSFVQDCSSMVASLLSLLQIGVDLYLILYILHSVPPIAMACGVAVV